MITVEDYNYLVKFLSETSGLELGLDKAYLIRSRLEPVVTTFSLKNITELVNQLRFRTDARLVDAVVDAMATKESLFFRDAMVYEKWQTWFLPLLYERKKNSKIIRIWSAACSTGQEPYSIAMSLELSPNNWQGWNIEILASDISKSALARARSGVYSQLEVQRGLNEALLKRFFKSESGGFRMNPEIAQRVIFKEVNLLHPLEGLGSFDVIFCRNVLIYFDSETKKKVLKKIYDLLVPDGFVVIGSSENTFSITDDFERAGPHHVGIYKKSGGSI